MRSDRLEQLGGMADDDSLRAGFHHNAIRAVAHLLARDGEMPTGEQLSALMWVLADDAERIAVRQEVDSSVRYARRGRPTLVS